MTDSSSGSDSGDNGGGTAGVSGSNASAFFSSIAGFISQRSAGKIAKRQSEVDAKTLKLASTQREIERQERLADALASQNASSGARNIAAFEGSPLTIINEDIRRSTQASERDAFATSLETLTLKSKGKLADRIGTFRATSGLLKTASSFASED